MRIRARLDSDEGAVAIIVSLFLMILLFVLALSIDINALRGDIRDEQSTSDFAALAAGQVLDPTLDYDPVGACETAWEYALANLEDATNDGSDPCGAFSSLKTTGCTIAADAQRAQGTVGPYVITITTPVPADDPGTAVAEDLGLLKGRSEDEEVDGWSCERLGVTVARSRDQIFGGVTDVAKATTSASAVVRAFSLGQVGEFASLVVLDRTGCFVLLASGQGTVIVDEYVDEDTGETTPGIIAVDTRGDPSDPSCSKKKDTAAPRNFAIDAGGERNSRICVGTLAVDGTCDPNGIIFSYGDRVGFGDGVASHEPSDVTDGRLGPAPVGGTLVTRKPGDHAYNCKPTYELASSSGNLQDPSDSIEGCENESGPYIDRLVAELGGTGGPGVTFTEFTEFPAQPVDDAGDRLYSCNETSRDIDLSFETTDSRNWWINCPSNGNNPGFSPTVKVTFPGGGYIVVEDGIALGSNASLTVGSKTSDDTVMFLRDGDPDDSPTLTSILDIGSQSSIQLWNTFTYIHDGFLDSGAGGESTPDPREGQPGDAECADGVDNDGDGKTDADDPDGDCSTGEGGSDAASRAASCADGIDNDADGKTDDKDSDCPLREGPPDHVTCGDGVDNDNDGDTDFDDGECAVRRFISPLQGAADHCEPDASLPAAACFEDLIVWTNSPAQHTMAGQGVLDLQGVFFTPNASPFSLTGGTDQTLSRAQFMSHRIEVRGQGTIRMRPNPEFNLQTELTGGGLIR